MVVARSLLKKPRYKSRLDAMIARICTEKVEVLPDEKIEDELRKLGPRKTLKRGGLRGRRQNKELVAFARLRGDEVFPGYSWQELRNAQREREENGVLCQTAVEIQSAVGCPFDCTYCPYNSFLCVRLNVDGFVDRVTKLAKSRQAQSLYKLNNRSDTLGLEPEYGLAAALIRRFAEIDGKYLLLYSKGDAVSHLLDLDHRGKTVASFTLTPEPIATMLEPGAPTPSARIEAIEKLSAAGYPLRVRFSPVVPLKGWRESYRDLIERLCDACHPEMVTLWTLSMVQMHELDRIVPLDALDDEALAAAREAAGQLCGHKGAPFPPSLRAAMYQAIANMVTERSPHTRVALCLETPEVWDNTPAVVAPCGRDEFLCNCGPRVVPAKPSG